MLQSKDSERLDNKEDSREDSWISLGMGKGKYLSRWTGNKWGWEHVGLDWWLRRWGLLKEMAGKGAIWGSGRSLLHGKFP